MAPREGDDINVSNSNSIDDAEGSSNGTSNTTTPPQTPAWIQRYIPEAFGLRQSIDSSKYRWCVRESALWGIATSTCLSLHRLRMQSRTPFVVNVGFLTFFTVYVGNYYFCVRRRDHQEKMVSL